MTGKGGACRIGSGISSENFEGGEHEEIEIKEQPQRNTGRAFAKKKTEFAKTINVDSKLVKEIQPHVKN